MPHTVRCGRKVTVPCASDSRSTMRCSSRSFWAVGRSQIEAGISQAPGMTRRSRATSLALRDHPFDDRGEGARAVAVERAFGGFLEPPNAVPRIEVMLSEHQ